MLVNSVDDFCLFAPPNPGPDSVIGETEVSACILLYPYTLHPELARTGYARRTHYALKQGQILIDGDTCPNAVRQLVASYHNSDGTRSEIRLEGDVAESALSHTSCILGVIIR